MQSASLEPLPLVSAKTDRTGSAQQPDPRVAEVAAQLPPHLELRRVIGEGGSSVVFEAFHTRLKVLVAVKVLSVRGELAAQAYRRMTREAELYALLDDPRIPRVYDVNELENGTPYVVMEMVPGRALEDLLRDRQPVAVRLALTIAHEVLSALSSVHERGVLHRDVKPANVILNFPPDGTCQVRLVDFGIAKSAAYGAPHEAVTQRGTLVGTPQYMPPERLTGQAADEASDTYAVGVMLYEMLTGQVPFGGPNLGAVMASVLRDVPPPLSERCSNVSPALSELVARAMARHPQDRFATARGMLDALEALPELRPEGSGARRVDERLRTPELSLTSDDLEDELRAAQRSKRSIGTLLIALVVLVMAAGGGLYFKEYQAKTARSAPTETPIPSVESLAPAPSEGPAPTAQPAATQPKQLLPIPPAPAAQPPQLERERPERAERDRRGRHARRTRQREESRPGPSPQIAPSPLEVAPAPAPTGPDYAKLLPGNPY